MHADASPSAFFATLSSPATFAKLCFFLEELVDTVNLEFDPKGLRVSSVDSTHGLSPLCSLLADARVALIHLELHQGSFINYDLGGARRYVVRSAISTPQFLTSKADWHQDRLNVHCYEER